MSNQLVKKNPAEGYQNVFPKTWIDAIKDKESGVSLQEILQGFNMYFLSYNGSRALTRCKVPAILRKEGLWITYVLYDHTVVTEWYNSDQIDDNSWSMDSNWRVTSNSLVGDVSVSADGYWVINGEKTEAKAQGEQGVTPLLRVGANNKLQVSYNAGKAWKDISDYIVPRFRYTRGTTNDTAGIIQISMDLGKTWTNLSNEITNNLRISRYIGTNESLPTSGVAEGTIYMKGPYYKESDTSNTNPIYRMWVYAWKGNTLAWQDNGEFASISAGVVQERGNSTTEVMSQDAVTRELTELEDKIGVLKNSGYLYAGVATPITDPGTPYSKVFYIATTPGTYTNLGGLVVDEGETSIFKYDTQWTRDVVNLNLLRVDDADSDFSIEDITGNAIVIFQGGHIKTKNFDSKTNSFTGENAKKLDSIEENAQVNNTIIEDTFPTDFAITDEEGKAIFGVVDGYPFSKNFDGKKVAKTSELVSDMKPYKTTIVSITDHNNNLMDVFAAISPTEENHYVILIPEGIYNVDEWFTPAQIAGDSSGFRGVELLNYTKLLGVGCADKIILQWINETYPHRSYISTLNTHEWNELENLTIKAKNIRYAVHDDIWNGLDRHIRVKNCSFIVSGSTSRAWGAGCNGGYDGVFENCKFIMEELTPTPTGRYVEPFVLHDNYHNTRGDSHLTLINCRFVTPYTSYHQPLDHNSWEAVAYDSSYPLYDASKKDYAVNDCINMPDDTSASYKCLYANTQVMPYGEGRPSLNIGFGAEGATQPLYVTMIGCYLSTYMAVTPTLVRVTGFGNKSDKTPTAILWDESDNAYSTIIDLI